MIACTTVRNNISSYIDGTMENSLLVEFEKHVCDCKDCKCELEEIMFVVNLCKDIEEVEPPTDFKAQLHDKLLNVSSSKDIKTNRKFNFIKYSSIAASVAVILLAAVLLKDIAFGGFLPKADQNMLSMSKAENNDLGSLKGSQNAKKSKVAADSALSDERQTNESEDSDSIKVSQTPSRSQICDRYSIAAVGGTSQITTNVSKTVALEVLANGDGNVVEDVNKIGTQYGNQTNTNFTYSADAKKVDPTATASQEESPAVTFSESVTEDKESTTATTQNGDGNKTTMSKSLQPEVDPASNIITLTIPNENYDKFINALKLKYGESNVKVVSQAVAGFAGSDPQTQEKEDNKTNIVDYTLFNINIVK